ncbi:MULTISPECIES: serine hydrolase domain-containing protein [Streptomyces]|uniref:Beta-lactamase class C and other penicillin binding proteins n=1 Tax=Streptomyces venezuelae (strain ATCC 10712 / CBS 650.69 / DSM 40230 / JCM 4526 / NBRC 13096 / PD 04745) TaxID=953739 RepID=F2RC65_STRVP|nr:serine hydrolase domain-containing protein [Streptomyces venezuelae]APE26541.1 serine hydrolase [Streptomyces venezuelae]QES03947.1 serine hydrolase [Streptomyces venezuelae ATCC 10712]CCA59316.1 Beta-lactamase class C and other penicillin binding proteins [Streptomyces venezuelae ATCC 10712]
MRRIPYRRLLVATLLVASVLAPVTATPATPVHAASADRHGEDDCPPGGLGPELTAKLDRTIEDVRKQANIPGVVVGLWMPGKGSYVKATGVADKATRRPMFADTFARIGSETKTFTVTALLKLVDDGRVRLDDPIGKYVHGVPKGNRITLRQLAEMRSGLFPYTADEDFIHDLLSDPQRTFTPEESLAYGYKHKNTFAPGARFQYSNSNLVLLGLVVEKVTGRPLAEVIDRRVLRPAHLRHTLFPEGAEFPEPHARGYTDQTLDGSVADATDWNPSWAWAAGAMISDLHDLRRWAKVVATGELLSPETQAQRLKMLPTGFPGTSYGLGILNSDGWIGHNGSIPGYETVTVYLPSKKATLVLIINTDSLVGGQEPSTLLARAITQVVTPDNVYAGGIAPRP